MTLANEYAVQVTSNRLVIVKEEKCLQQQANGKRQSTSGSKAVYVVVRDDTTNDASKC